MCVCLCVCVCESVFTPYVCVNYAYMFTLYARQNNFLKFLSNCLPATLHHADGASNLNHLFICVC